MTILIQSYLVNFGFTLIKMILFAIGSWGAYVVVDKFSAIDIRKQLSDGELGAWIWWSALIIALSFIVGRL